MLRGKTVLLGVTGSIAAYKAASLVSMLMKAGATVHVIMTKNAEYFIHPITFESLSKNKCITDIFDRDFTFEVEHISLAQKADIFVVAPASADMIAKLCYGLADDMLSTTALACTCRKIIAPAMNTNMYKNGIVQGNLQKLKQAGFLVMEPGSGRLACGAVGEGKMPEPEEIFEEILCQIACEKDYSGLKVLVTAGPTREPIDPVRFITNHSSGKMGYALAKAAMLRGAEVTLISGKTALTPPKNVNFIEIQSAMEMFEAVQKCYANQDIVLKAAAVADYAPKQVSNEKIKKSNNDLSLELERTPDILAYMGENKRNGQFLCGFSMETENMLENSKAKLIKKKIDMIAANNLKDEGAGFETDTNVLTVITKEKEIKLPILSKEEAAHRLLDMIKEEIK